MTIDIHTKSFALANKTGGLSGPAIKPVALRMVYQVANAVSIPLVAMGGIATAEDAIEFILAGATGISVGTANFYNPYATIQVIEGIRDYMKEYGYSNLSEMIGTID
jgi:dihydroorotate dehydrogenase (NAD+) catalytic subunit